MPTVDFNTTVVNLLPFAQRLAKWKIFAKSLVWGTQRDNVYFQYYTDGSTDSGYWSSLVPYDKGNLVRSIDGVFESLNDGNIGNAVTDTTYWLKVLGSFIGANERVRYNGRKLTFEWALNRYFNTTFRQPDDPVTPTPSDIFIDNQPVVNSEFVMYTYPPGSSVMYPQSSAPKYMFFAPVYTSATTFQFNTNIPIAVFNALGANDPIRESIVRNFADKYCVSGTFYNVVTY